MISHCKDYPRPQLARNEWRNLNGKWAFAFDDSDIGESEEWQAKFPENHRDIVVPFTYETKLSGIQEVGHHENVWYSRIVNLESSELDGKCLLLHFEGSDFRTLVWVNGTYVGDHRGGYSRFSFDITKYVEAGGNVITVKVEDSKNIAQPRGKQRWINESFGCWYIQTTGIWKTVWMESVETSYVSCLKITPDIEGGNIDIVYDINTDLIYGDLYIEAVITYQGELVGQSCKQVENSRMKDIINISSTGETNSWGLYLWTPEDPCLYDLEIRLRKGEVILDKVASYFGMREIRIDGGNILLNGHPIYQRLILDQGYWEESHLTPPSEESLIEDIDKIHALGYNGLRKHMKVEDERFLYWCDVKGMLVWSEMAACYAFNDDAVEEFTNEWMEVVRQNYNHPSIITWTPFNESWGIAEIKTNREQQHFTEAIYHLIKSFDGMRPVIVNDGWEHTVSDILTIHDYQEDGSRFYERYQGTAREMAASGKYPNGDRAAFAENYAYKGQPVIISEYGGIAFSGGKDGQWGYGKTVSDEREFLKRFECITAAIKKIPYIVGYCYTQVSDVQQEINGLLKADRTYKLPLEEIYKINMK